MELKTDALLERGKYRIVRTLGRGGFGVTYLAEQVLAKRKVCIKEFFPKDYYKREATTGAITLTSDGFGEMMDKFKAKFIKEAQTIAALDHPNIIPIHDVFEENDTAYYVMEYIEGGSLQDVVRKRGALPTDVALALMNPVIDAVGYIHDHRIMHLDIKPGNIMVREKDGRPILIDFGLSKQYDEEGNQTSSTPVGISHGFAPIEQYQMGGVSAFSPQTDIYSLGATLYYLVSGTVPPQAAIVANEGMPELPATISTNVRTAIEKAMEFRSKQRPESIAILKQLLGNKVVSAPVSAQPSADTVIDIVEDNSATQIDGGATQIDVPKDDATQIDGGSETAIELEPQPEKRVVPEPKVAPKPEPKVAPKPEPKSVSASKPTEPKKKSKWWLWLLLLIVAGVVAVIVLNANDGYGDTYYEDYGYGGTYYESYDYNDEAEMCELEAYEPEVYEQPEVYIEPTDYHNGYGYVDLGLSVKWATCNVGASSPGDCGNYYAWGETSTKSSYTDGNCTTLNQYIGDIAGTSRDAARVNWGGRWRMPSASEIDELVNNCTWVWTTQNGNNGYMITSPNGNSIFLPAAGEYNTNLGELWGIGYVGSYWSSDGLESTHGASRLHFYDYEIEKDWHLRCHGYSIRPVLD